MKNIIEYVAFRLRDPLMVTVDSVAKTAKITDMAKQISAVAVRVAEIISVFSGKFFAVVVLHAIPIPKELIVAILLMAIM